MSSPDQKFKKRWSDHLTFYQDTAQGMDEKTIQFIPKIPECKVERDHDRDRSLDSERTRRRWKTFYSMNLSASNFFVEMLSEIPISSQGPTKVEAQLLHDAERRIEYFDKFRPGYLLYSGLGSEKCWFFEKYANSEKGKWDTLTQKIHEDLSRKQAKHPARVPRFLQRRTAKGRKKTCTSMQHQHLKDECGTLQSSQ